MVYPAANRPGAFGAQNGASHVKTLAQIQKTTAQPEKARLAGLAFQISKPYTDADQRVDLRAKPGYTKMLDFIGFAAKENEFAGGKAADDYAVSFDKYVDLQPGYDKDLAAKEVKLLDSNQDGKIDAKENAAKWMAMNNVGQVLAPVLMGELAAKFPTVDALNGNKATSDYLKTLGVSKPLTPEQFKTFKQFSQDGKLANGMVLDAEDRKALVDVVKALNREFPAGPQRMSVANKLLQGAQPNNGYITPEEQAFFKKLLDNPRLQKVLQKFLGDAKGAIEGSGRYDEFKTGEYKQPGPDVNKAPGADTPKLPIMVSKIRDANKAWYDKANTEKDPLGAKPGSFVRSFKADSPPGVLEGNFRQRLKDGSVREGTFMLVNGIYCGNYSQADPAKPGQSKNYIFAMQHDGTSWGPMQVAADGATGNNVQQYNFNELPHANRQVVSDANRNLVVGDGNIEG